MCEGCYYRGTVAEASFNGEVIAYFCKLYKFEYEVCDVGVVSPNYECEAFKPITRLKIIKSKEN